jgi:diguanylate cyclase
MVRSPYHWAIPWQAQAENPNQLYANADAALYHAKHNGRNRTVYFDEAMRREYAGKNWLIYRN